MVDFISLELGHRYIFTLDNGEHYEGDVVDVYDIATGIESMRFIPIAKIDWGDRFIAINGLRTKEVVEV